MMLFLGALIGFSSALLSSFTVYVFLQESVAGKTYEVEVKTGRGWHKGKVHFKEVNKPFRR